MSDFTINCPHCQSGILVTPEHVGLEIACPTCQKPVVVPPDPSAPAPAPAKAGTRLAASTSAPPAHTPAPLPPGAQMGKPTKKPKKKAGLIIGICSGVVALGALIYFWPQLMAALKKEDAAKLAAQVDTNVPPPPPPELSTEEILDKLSETYKGFTDYSARAQTVGELDLSGLIPGSKSMQTSTKSSLQFGRTNYYRLEWDQTAAGKEVKGAAWNAGKGNYVEYGAAAPNKVKTRDLAVMPALQSFILSPVVMEVFFDTTNSVTKDAKDFTKTNAPDLENQQNWVLAGEVEHQSVLIWIRKDSFVINKIMLKLGGMIDDAELKKMPSSQRAQMQALSKIKGKVTEEYSQIQTNQHLMAATYETPFKPAAPGAPGNAAASQRPGSRAGQLVAPIKRRQQAAQPPPQ